MSLFQRFRKKSYQTRLLEEQNALLRELITAITGKAPAATRTREIDKTLKPRTESDVTFARRHHVEDQRRAELQHQQAPWQTPGSGPDSAPHPSNTGQAPPEKPPERP